MDREFLCLCREAAYYVALCAERNRSGHALGFHREFISAIHKREQLLGAVPGQENALQENTP
jgi:hypothetical protein